MPKVTIAQRIKDEMFADGYEYVGSTSGLHSYRRGSNLSKKLLSLGLTPETCIVRPAARAGRFANDGYQLLIFVNPYFTGDALKFIQRNFGTGQNSSRIE